MTHITDIKEIYKISKEIFGENFLQINDPINKISHAWKYINYAYDQSWRLGQNIIVPEAKDLISTLNFYVIFKKLDLMDFRFVMRFS